METLGEPSPSAQPRRVVPLAAGATPAPRRTPKPPRRETASRFQEESLPPPSVTLHPEGCSALQRSTPDPSRDPSSDPSTPWPSEDNLGASRCRDDPKTALTPREPVSEPQDPFACAATYAPSPRRAPNRRRRMRRDPADCHSLQPTSLADPEGSIREPGYSPDSPRSSSTPANHRAARLRRDPTRRQSPAPSSVERDRSCATLPFGPEEPAGDARPELSRPGASLERREVETARARRIVPLALATPWAA